MATLSSSYQFLGRSSVMTSTNGKLSYYLLLYGKTVPNQTTGFHKVTIKSVLASTITNATYYSYTQSHNGKINGSTAFSGTNKPSKAWELSSFSAGGVSYKTGTLLGEGSVSVDCTNGLSKDITVSCYYKFNDDPDSYTPAKGTNRTVSVTVTLSAIPRQATLLSAQNFTDGDNPTITYSNPSGDSVTSLEAAIYNDSGTQSYVPYQPISKTASSHTFNLTEGERENLMNAVQEGDSISVRFYVRTVIGGVTYLSTPITRTFSINDANPKITASVVDTNATTIALTGDSSKLIRYYSNAYATMTAEAKQGSAINESLYIIRNGDNTGYGDSHTFNNVEDNVFTFSAEDSRGNIGTATVTSTMVNYVNLTCNIENTRPDANGNMDVRCTGSYFNGSFGAVANTLTVECRYRNPNGTYSGWYPMTVTKNGNYYGAYTSFTIPDFNYQAVYAFECKATDKLASTSSIPSSVKSIPVFHWSEDDFVFEVPVTFNAGVNNSTATSGVSSDQTIDGDLNVTGDLRLKGSGNYGNTLRFGDGDYCYIKEPSDDVMTIHAKQLNLDTTNGVYLGSNKIPNIYTGSWTPSLNASAVSSYSSQSGWYTKIGQTVIVGFHIKASCRSGYDSTSVTIGGLPYVPSVAASGGGMCSGVHVSAGFNFQCYVAETSGTITTRVQACNNTTATSLSTSASGCWYRSGGGEITISGTITYMASS